MRTAADFRQTTRSGMKATRGSVVVYVHTTAEAAPVRVGVITSSSVGGSVARHRAARRIRGAVAGIVSSLPTGSRVVVRALPGADRDPLVPQQVSGAIASVLTELSRR